MDNILKEILKAEKRAKDFANEAEKYRVKAIAEVEEEKKQIIEQKLEQAKQEAERLKLEHKQSVIDSMKAYEEECKSSIEDMKKIAEKKSADWEDEIFRKVISVQ